MARPDRLDFDGETLWVIGCGNMGRAMLDRWLDCGLDPGAVTVIDPAIPRLRDGVRVVAMVEPDAPPPTLALLAVKPQLLDTVAKALATRFGRETTLVSILAGVTLDSLRARFAVPKHIVKAMPNLPVAIGKGVVALYGDIDPPTPLSALMALLGAVEWLDAEAHFDAVTALSGSGPAFVCRFVEAMAMGGAALGLPTEQAARMALATVGGTAALLDCKGESPAAMARRVTSPNGTTQAGLAILDEGDEFARRVRTTLAAAAARSAALAAEAV